MVNYWDKYTEMHGQQNVKINLTGKDDWLVLYIAGCSESRTEHINKCGGQKSNFLLNFMERTVTSEP